MNVTAAIALLLDSQFFLQGESLVFLLCGRGHLTWGELDVGGEGGEGALQEEAVPVNTRNSNTFYLFLARTNIRLFGIRFQGPKFFNSLNNNIQSAATISLFKSR